MYLLKVISRFDTAVCLAHWSHRTLIVIWIVIVSLTSKASENTHVTDTVNLKITVAVPKDLRVFQLIDSVLSANKISQKKYAYVSIMIKSSKDSYRLKDDEKMAIYLTYNMPTPPISAEKDYYVAYNNRKYFFSKENDDIFVNKKQRKKLFTFDKIKSLENLTRYLYPFIIIEKNDGKIVVLTYGDDDYIRFVE